MVSVSRCPLRWFLEIVYSATDTKEFLHGKIIARADAAVRRASSKSFRDFPVRRAMGGMIALEKRVAETDGATKEENLERNWILKARRTSRQFGNHGAK